MNRIQTLLLFVCVFFTGCSKFSNDSESLTAVNGEVFIVTQGAENIKLGAVEIFAIPSETFNSNFQERKSEIKSAIDKNEVIFQKCLEVENKLRQGAVNWNESEKEKIQECGEFIKSGKDSNLPGLILDKVPENSVSATTNSDGKFLLNLPQGKKYAIFAKSQRKVANKEEKYFWLESIETKDKMQNIILSNKNLLTTDHLKLLVQ